MERGAVVYEGPSLLDGAPIVVVASALYAKSASQANAKTGDVIQTWILRRDVAPAAAVRSGADASICGDCALRPVGPDGTLRGCYVHLGLVGNLWLAYRRGSYSRLTEIDRWPELVGRRQVRLGAYGDPAAVPIEVWWTLVDHASGHFGYTHAWRYCDQRLRELVMASVDTEAQRLEARAKLWRTFRTRFEHEELAGGEIVCPASAEGGKKTSCDRCSLCNGARVGDRRRDIAIVTHGNTTPKGYRAARAVLRVLEGRP